MKKLLGKFSQEVQISRQVMNCLQLQILHPNLYDGTEGLYTLLSQEFLMKLVFPSLL